jgi:hypothetical protein
MNATRALASSPIPVDETSTLSALPSDVADRGLSPTSGDMPATTASRHTSEMSLEDGDSTFSLHEKPKNGRSRGKGKEKEKPTLRVKEEPATIVLPPYDHPSRQVG